MPLKCNECLRDLPLSLFDIKEPESEVCIVCCNAYIAEAEIKELKSEMKALQLIVEELLQGSKAQEKSSTSNVKSNPVETEISYEEKLDDGFKFPNRRRVAKRIINRICNSPVPVSNRFQGLANKNNDEPPVFLVGDSYAKFMDEEFCSRRNRKRRRMYLSGGDIDDITAAINSELKDDSNEHLVLLSSGNDVALKRPSELYGKYKSLLNSLIDKRRGVACVGIVPRLSWNKYEYNQGCSINKMLEELCRVLNIAFINVWDEFQDQKLLYARDGIHLNSIGNARLGRLIDTGFISHIANFRALNQLAEIQ